MTYESTEEILRSITIPQVNLLPSSTSFVKIYQASDQFELLDSSAHVSRDKIIETFHKTIEAFRQLKQEFEEALADSHLSSLEYNYKLAQDRIRDLYKKFKHVSSERNTLSSTLKDWKHKLVEKDDQLIKTFKREEIMNHKLRGRLNNFKEAAKRKNKAINLLITAAEENALTLSEFNHLYKHVVRAYDTDANIDVKVLDDGIIQILDINKNLQQQQENDGTIISFAALKDSYYIRSLSTMILEDRRFILNCIQNSEYDYNRILKNVDEYYQRNDLPDDEYDTGLNQMDIPEIEEDEELDTILKEESMPTKIHFFRVKQAISACIEKVVSSQNGDLTTFELDADDAYQDALNKLHIIYKMVHPIMFQHNPKIDEAKQKVKYNVTRLRESLDAMKQEMNSMNASFKKFMVKSKKEAQTSLKRHRSKSVTKRPTIMKRSKSKSSASRSSVFSPMIKSESSGSEYQGTASSIHDIDHHQNDQLSETSSSIIQDNVVHADPLRKIHSPAVIVSTSKRKGDPSNVKRQRHTSHGYRRSIDQQQQANMFKAPLHRPCHTHRTGPYFPKLSKTDTVDYKAPNINEVDVSYWFKESKKAGGTRRFNRILHPYLNK